MAFVRLGEISTIVRGGNFQKKDFTKKGFPCIHYGQMYTHNYSYNSLLNIQEVATAQDKNKVEEIKKEVELSGFNSIFCVSSVEMAKLYYNEFKKNG